MATLDRNTGRGVERSVLKGGDTSSRFLAFARETHTTENGPESIKQRIKA